MNAMNNLMRSLIAASVIAAHMMLGSISIAGITQTPHKAVAETRLSKVGFLDFKTLLYSPMTGDDLAGVSNQIKFIGPDMFRNAALRPSVLQKLRSLQNPVMPVSPLWGWEQDNLDILKSDMTGKPMGISPDLVDAILTDITDNIRHHGISWMLNPTMGPGTTAYFNSATKKVIDQIEILENASFMAPAISSNAYAPQPVTQIPQPNPQPVLIFGLGLLTIGLLRRWSRRKSPLPLKKADPSACFDAIRNSPIRYGATPL